MLNNYLIPFLVMLIISYGYFKKNNIYESFLAGAKEGLKTSLTIIPSILAMIFAVNIFTKSGLFTVLKNIAILPMIILKPISGTASFAYLNSLYQTYGVDSYLSFLASIMESSTDTTIYVLALYFGSIKVFQTKYALKVGLFADLCGLGMSFLIAKFFFN